MLKLSVDESQRVLEDPSVESRLRLLLESAERLGESQKVRQEVQGRLEKKARRQLRESVVRAQIVELQKELKRLKAGDRRDSLRGIQEEGREASVPKKAPEKDDFVIPSHEPGEEVEMLRKGLKEVGLPEEVKKVALRELGRLSQLQAGHHEWGVISNYLETLRSLPWNQETEDRLDIQEAKRILDRDHFGLEKAKRRILEFLAVKKLKDQNQKKALEEQNASREAVTPTSPQDSFESSEEKENAEAPYESPKEIPPSPPPCLHVDSRGPILCLHGPPGVGKTSLGQSIAESLGRKFIRISLGGVRDESELRGHRKTYVGAMPGVIISSLAKCGAKNPVILLDEIEKMASGHPMFNPYGVLLEILDPEQNKTFRDHFLGVPFDLSNCLFICTANVLQQLPPPLLDRLELIEVSGYSLWDKLSIAKHHLLPKQMDKHGLREGDVKVEEEAVLRVVEGYTRESGVRWLDRRFAEICRWLASRMVGVPGEEGGTKGKDVETGLTPEGEMVVSASLIPTILGEALFDAEGLDREVGVLPGLAAGLAVTQTGGEILYIEVACTGSSPPSSPPSRSFIVTGQLGSVMQESVSTALSLLSSRVFNLSLTRTPAASVSLDGASLGVPSSPPSILRCIDPEEVKRLHLHVHFPTGAIQKDGPSAGVATFLALASFFAKTPLRPLLASTGEVSLRGAVLPVGGVKEKILAAHRGGVKVLILPYLNRKGIREEIPKKILDSMEIAFVRNVDEALSAAFEGVEERRRKGGKGHSGEGGKHDRLMKPLAEGERRDHERVSAL